MTKYLNAAPTQHAKLLAWVEEWVNICKPDAVYWCDGSAAEYDRLADEMVASGLATRLDKKPHSVLFRSDVSDVAGRRIYTVKNNAVLSGKVLEGGKPVLQ